jgi:hypothetical protein
MVVVNLKLYRLAWAIALVLAAFSLLTLRAPELVAVSDQPLTFDGERAMQTVRTLARDYPQRLAGSSADKRSTVWLSDQLVRLGYAVHSDPFTATINGRDTVMRNIWAVSPGDAEGTIVVLANRDSPPRSTQGADNNASGVAAVLQLADVFATTAHEHPIAFVWTDGDTYGGLGAQQFVDDHCLGDESVAAVITLRTIAGAKADRVAMNGWTASPVVAPPWLWVLTRAATQAETRLRAPLPFIAGQLLRLAVPAGTGSQAPFVSAGIPAIALSDPRTERRPPADTLDKVSVETLGKFGRITERMVVSIDAAPDQTTRAGDQLFFSKYRRIGGGAVTWALVVLSLPLVVFTVALWVAAVRRRAPIAAAWSRLGLRLAPWAAVLLLTYVANLVGLLPQSPGALIPPESELAHNPRYLRVAVLVLVLALGYHYAMAIERRLVRRRPTSLDGTLVVAFTTATAILVPTVIVNPFSLFLLLPIGILWPLAGRGSWYRSRLPVWSGLALMILALAYLGLRLRLDWTVWWYFFLLLENRTIPVAPIALGIALVGATALLGHDLNRPPEEPADVTDPGTRRRERERRRALAGDQDTDAGLNESGPPAGGPLSSRSRRHSRRRR